MSAFDVSQMGATAEEAVLPPVRTKKEQARRKAKRKARQKAQRRNRKK